MAKRATRPKRTPRRRRDTGTAAESAELTRDVLSELPSFTDLHPSAVQLEAFRQATGPCVSDCYQLGCVVRLDRGFPAVLTASGLFRAEFAAQLTKSAYSRVAVGDWVCARSPEGHPMGLVEVILPRTSDIARWRGGSRGEKQTLAANVDTVLVVQAADRFSINRIARSAVVALDCGARCAVVLTKADIAGESETKRALRCVHSVLGESCAAVAVCSDPSYMRGIEQVRALVPAGEVAIMLGPSGVGKSTLLNALLGHAAMETGAVRASDGVGRHTTVARRMVAVPGAGVIVDEPGLRTLQMVGHEKGLARVFPDIARAAAACRFRNCTHTHEPGCAVRERFADPADARLAVYLALAAEMRESAQVLDPDVVL